MSPDLARLSAEAYQDALARAGNRIEILFDISAKQVRHGLLAEIRRQLDRGVREKNVLIDRAMASVLAIAFNAPRVQSDFDEPSEGREVRF